ncbi:MAG: hypothetical protein ACRD04_14775 [Terriglobales bacterium]
MAGQAVGVGAQPGDGNGAEIDGGRLRLEGIGAEFEDGAVVGVEADGKGLVAKDGVEVSGSG